jgi:hypothetical protein
MPLVEVMTNLAAIRATAKTVAREKDDLDAAGRELRTEKAKLLESVIQALKPALPAMCSVVGLSQTYSQAGATTDPAGWRGLYLAGDGPTGFEAAVVGKKADRGRYIGERLMLRQDGVLVLLTYDGPWSTVPGEVSSWRATERVMTSVEALGSYDIETLIGALQEALAAQAGGGSPRRAAALREKAERLKALATLVRSWR